MKSRALSIDVAAIGTVSALLLKPRGAQACYVFAHGAGAGMDHPFMQGIAEKLAEARIATLRYQFPYMQAHSKRPDRPPVCLATVRAAVALARKKCVQIPLIAGGKSFGGRMTSQAQALDPLPAVVGLVFFGFPWHLPKQPALHRSEHLAAVRLPMLFLQGGQDPMGDPKLVSAQVQKRRKNWTLHSVPDADHGFHVPIRSGRTDSQVQEELACAFSKWLTTIT
jgi:predicted alpha/beta-hydrolase family hydrolase